MKTLVSELGLSIRVANALKLAGIETIAQLRAMTAQEIDRLPNIGRKAFSEIAEQLNLNGIELSEIQTTLLIAALASYDCGETEIAELLVLLHSADRVAVWPKKEN